MQEIGNITAFVSFNFLLVLMAFWLFLAMALYEIFHRGVQKINNKSGNKRKFFRLQKIMVLASVLITILLLFNIIWLANDMKESYPQAIIAIVLNIIFYIGMLFSLVAYKKMKKSDAKDIFTMRKVNYVFVFTTTMLFANMIYTYIWSK